MGVFGHVFARFEFVGTYGEEFQKKNTSLHSFLLKKRREARKRVEESEDVSADRELLGLSWLINGDISKAPKGQIVYCDDCTGTSSDFFPFLKELEKRYPDISYVITSSSWQSTFDYTTEGNVIYRKARESKVFPGEILSSRIPCGGGCMFLEGVGDRDEELKNQIVALVDGFRAEHVPTELCIDEWTWLNEEMDRYCYSGFRTRFAVPGTADAIGEVCGAIAERFPELEIYGRIDTPESLSLDGEEDDGLGTEVLSCGVTKRCYFSPAGFKSIGWNEGGKVSCLPAFTSFVSELTDEFVSSLPRTFLAEGRGAKQRSQMSVGEHVVMQMNIDSNAGQVGPHALNSGFCEYTGGFSGHHCVFEVSLKTDEGKGLGKMVLDRKDAHAIALNMGRLSAKVASLDPFEIEVECVDPDGTFDIKPLFAFKKNNRITSV